MFIEIFPQIWHRLLSLRYFPRPLYEKSRQQRNLSP